MRCADADVEWIRWNSSRLMINSHCGIVSPGIDFTTVQYGEMNVQWMFYSDVGVSRKEGSR